MLEESRERTKREQFSEWTSNRGELERAHAQINKLQQQKSVNKKYTYAVYNTALYKPFYLLCICLMFAHIGSSR